MSEMEVSEKTIKDSETIMYYLTKNAARTGFIDWLEDIGLSEEDYEKVKEYWAYCGIGGTYV